MTARRRGRAARGGLAFIAVLFLGSALIRFGVGVGAAFARAPAEAAAECPADGGTMALLADLRAREQGLIEREGRLADREQAQNLAQQAIEERLTDLIAAEEKLARTVAIADGAAEEDVARLITLYENMKPKEAAPLFAEMAPEFAAGFLARMRPDAAAAVLAGLEPKTAYTISVVLAGRNANAPKN